VDRKARAGEGPEGVYSICIVSPPVQEVRLWLLIAVAHSGQHACVGKQAAYNQLRLVVTRLVLAFRVEPGESFDEVKCRSQWRDYFIAALGELPLKFQPRA
jgi:hypothetical protein